MAALIALGGLTSSAFAQVDYVRELVGTTDIGTDIAPLLAVTQAPSTQDP